MDISRLGVFAFLDSMEGAASAEFARSVERLGYSVLWVVEGSGRNSLSYAPWLLARTETLVVATGVASVWARAASTMAAGARTAAELSGGRFILGVGTNNHVSAAMRGLAYDRPVTYMREYLRAMKLAAYDAPAPNGEVPVLLAANNPRMLALAGSDAQGTITYFVTPEHTARAREIIGPKLCLCAVQAVMLERDAPRARAAARSYMKLYLRIPAYLKNLRTLGFDDTDFAAGGSNRLTDAIVAWGSEARLRDRIESHYEAGATHVCVLALSPEGGLLPDARALKALAPSVDDR
jgi:probable F420-dependent oxidoreductase